MTNDFISMVDNVFSFNKGGGVRESLTASVLAILLGLAFILALFIPTNDKALDFLLIILASIGSFYFGRKTEEYKKE